MSRFFQGKFIVFVSAFLALSGVFLFSKTAESAWDANIYNKPYNGTLTATEWNNLLLDFPAVWLPVTFKGPVTIGAPTSTATTLNVYGNITATNFSGAYTGTLGAQNVSSGAFGSNTGGGNYSFPGNVGVGITNPGAKLDVSDAGASLFRIKSTANHAYFTIDSFTSRESGILFATNGVNAWELYKTSGLDFSLYNYSRNASDLWVKNSNGYVGIGMMNPNQKLTINEGHINFTTISEPSALTGVVQAGSGMGTGNYRYRVSFVTATGETSVGTASSNIVTTTGNQQVLLSNIPIGPTGVIARKIYRSKNSGNYDEVYYLATISDNTTTTFLDTVPDSSLSVSPSYYNTTGGTFYVNNSPILRVTTNDASIASLSLGYLAGGKGGRDSTFIGSYAGGATISGTTGNVFVGSYAGYKATQSVYNNFFGNRSGFENTTGNYNLGFGSDAMRFNTTGGYNVAVGNLAGYGPGSVVSYYYNTLLGNYAGQNLSTNANNNTLLGYAAGDNITTGQSNIIIGSSVDAPGAASSSQLNIGNWIYGANGNIGIGSSSPAAKLAVNGGTSNVIYTGGGQISGLPSVQTENDQAVSRKYLHDNFTSTSTVLAGSLWSGAKNGSIWNGDSGVGNVGIGTTNPYTSLSIKSPVTNKNDFLLTLHGADNGGAWYGLGFGLTAHPASFIKAGITYQITNSTYGSGNLNFLIASSTNGTNATTTDAKMTITHQGNVGIGVTNPGVGLTPAMEYKLHIKGSGTGTTGRTAFVVENTSADSAASFILKNSVAGEYISAQISGSTYASGHSAGFGTNGLDLKFGTDGETSTGGTSKILFSAGGYGNGPTMTILPGNPGNVGIGTTNPGSSLHVVNPTVGAATAITINAGSYPTTYKTQLGTQAGAQGILILGNNNSNEIRFGNTNTGGFGYIYTNNRADYNAASDGTLAMTFAASGNIGIGTASPRNKLDFSSSTVNQINIAGGYVSGLNSTPVNIDQAVPLGYLQNNYAPIGTGVGSAFVQGGNTFGATALLGTNDNYPLNFETNNTVRLTVAANGNVGVGTSTPIAKLDVYAESGREFSVFDGYYQFNIGGDAYSYGGPNSNNFSIWKNASKTYFNTSGGDSGFIFRTDNIDKVAINSAGNVGIGTTTPSHKLTVMGSGYFLGDTSVPNSPTDLGFYLGKSLADENRRMEVVSPTGGVSYIDFTEPGLDYRGRLAYYLSDNSFRFYTNSLERMRVDSSGNVGVGITNPSNPLHVVGRIYSTTIVQGDEGAFRIMGTYGRLNNNAELDAQTGYNLLLQTRGNGSVGINTTSPVAKLAVSAGTGNAIYAGGGQVAGLNSTPTNPDHAVPLLYLQNNYAPIGTGVGSAFVQGGNSFGGIATLGTNDNNLLNIETNNAVRMTVATNGNVGIGTTTPTQKVTIDSGNLLFNDYNSQIQFGNSGNIIAYDGIKTGGYWDIVLDQRRTGSPMGIKFRTNNTDRMYINSSGNVGIGTTDPGALEPMGGWTSNGNNRYLEIKNNPGAGFRSGVFIRRDDNATGLDLVNEGNLGDVYIANRYNSNTAHTSFLMKTNGTSVTAMSILGSGNVGIGTSSPAAKLVVSGGTGNVVHVDGGQIAGLNSTPLNTDHAVPLGYLQSNYVPLGSGAGGVGTGTVGQTLRHNGTSWVANSVVYNNGTNVGIGTTTPTTKLNVVGTFSATASSSSIMLDGNGDILIGI